MSVAPSPTWLAPAPLSSAPRSRRFRRVLLAGAGLFAVAGLLTYLVLWLRPPVAAKVFLWTASYDATTLIPPNADGITGANRLHLAARSGRSGHFHADPQPYRFTRADFARQLADLADYRGPSVLLVFAVKGGCDGQGAFLIPDDAGSDPADRIRIPTILDALAKLPRTTRKLVVFDATASPAIPALGQFHNDFARGLAALDRDIAAVDRLVVYSSSGPDQRSHLAAERGTTAFWHLLHRGMQGDADANRDGRLSAGELLEFTTRQTQDWAADHHSARQIPVVLPLDGEGERRAAEMPLSLVEWPAPADPLPVPFVPPQEWEDAWKRYRELEKADVHPTIYAPELWQEYTQWLLRYDRLATLNPESASGALQNSERIREKIMNRRAIEAVPQTLQLSFSLGAKSSAETLARSAFETLVALPEAGRAAGVSTALNSLGGETVPHRLELARAAIAWLADDPLTRWTVTDSLLGMICEPLPLKPAEVQFVMRLTTDLPSAAKTARAGPVLKQILRLRLQAEAIATGALGERVRPWIRLEIEAADALRRQAEDWLFVANEEAWERTADLANRAETSYRRAGEIAAAVRAAETAWQTGTVTLTNLSEWVADGPRRTELTDRIRGEAILKEAQDAWQHVHQLAQLCRSTPDTEHVPELVNQTRGVTDAVAKLSVAHENAVRELLASREKLETRTEFARWWSAAEAVLTVPGGENRKLLVTELRRVSRQLAITDKTTPDPQAIPSESVAREVARDHARRRGLLHLARLGQPDPGNPSLAFQFDQFAKLADATEMLTSASDSLLSRFVEVAKRISTEVNQTETLPDADWLARVTVLPTSADAAYKLRRTQAAELLDWQAQRAETDFWAGGDGTATPYFQRAATALKTSAATLRNLPVNPQTPADAFPFVVVNAAKQVVTDEPKPLVQYQLDANKKLAFGPGIVAFWDSANPGQRWSRDTASQPTASLNLTIPPRTEPLPTAPTVESSTVALAGYFRGRSLAKPVSVERYPVPHVTAVSRPLGEQASIAVRADAALRNRYGTGTGTLHFVVDATGSMRGDPEKPGDRGRYGIVCDALETVLKQIPPGVVVTVSAFGHRTAPKKDGSFETILPYSTWAADSGETIATVMKQLSALEPWDESPIVRSVFRARDALKGRAGLTAVILLSDAIDTTFVNDTEANPKKMPVKEAIVNAFSTGETALHVVAVPVTDKSELASQDEFRAVTDCKPKGVFVAPEQIEELLAWLRTATAARIRVALSDADSTRQLLTGTESGDNWLSPLIPPGRYTASAMLGSAIEQSLDLRPGERLLLSLQDGTPNGKFTRPNSLTEGPALARKSASDWTVAAPWQRLRDSGGIEILLGIDRESASVNALSPSRIADAWFEVAPSVANPVALRWAAEPGWPAPTWQLSTRGWPSTAGSGSPAKITAWWSEREKFPMLASWKPAAGLSILNTPRLKIAEVELESVTVEEHEVEVAPAQRSRRSCLVVRLASPAGDSVIARPTGSTPVGSDLRVYQDAGKTTCLFWWNDAEARNAVTGFELVSLAAVKKLATKVELPVLPPASISGPLPTPSPR